MLVHARPPVARAIFLSGQVGYHAYPKIIRLDTTPMAAPDKPTPTEIKLHQKSGALEIAYADGKVFNLPCEFLRVHSPSAEVRGHGPGQEVLQIGKKDVAIDRIEPVGTYAVQLYFSDGHDTGIYSWDLLYDFGARQAEMWAHYLGRIAAAGASRDKK